MTILRFSDLIGAFNSSVASDPNARQHETRGEYRLNSAWKSEEVYKTWSQIAVSKPPECVAISIVDAAGGSVAFEKHSFDELREQAFTVVVRKTLPPCTYLFFTLDGFRNGLADTSVEREARRVLICQKFDSFRSLRCVFETADGADLRSALPAPPTTVADVDKIDVRKLVRYLLSDKTQSSLAFWLPAEGASDASDVWLAWALASSKRLALIPVNEVWVDSGALMLGLAGPKAGPRKRTIVAKLDNLDARRDFPALSAAAAWVCEIPRECSVRHTYLTSELAREWPPDDPEWSTQLYKRLPAALEGAKAHYDAHLLETSGEMLKTLTDLRKAIGDETQKAIERTQGLLSSLAANLAAILGVLILRSTPLLQPTAAADGFWTRFIFGALAAWLIFVCVFSLTTNWRFRAALNSGRQHWHAKIHALLSNSDFRQIATDPLSRAERVYNWSAVSVACIYLVVASGLVAMAYNPDKPSLLVTSVLESFSKPQPVPSMQDHNTPVGPAGEKK